MKNTFKKIISMILTFSLIFSFGMMSSVFAAADDKLTITGIDTAVEVVGYQIVKEVNGKWVKANDTLSIANPESPTAQEISTIAGDSTKLQSLEKVTFNKEGADYVANNPKAGIYLVLVKNNPDAKAVYSPMLVSADYNGTNGTNKLDLGTTAKAKKTTPKVDKKIIEKTTNDKVTNDTTQAGDTLAIGDTVKFEITTSIPNYGKDYNNEKLKFTISDTMSEGLDLLKETIVVTNGTQELTKDNQYELVATEHGFEIKFKREYLVDGSDKNQIKVVYQAKLNAKAKTGFDPNTNEAKIEYTNNPNGKTVDDTDKTYHYTFDIDGNIGGKVKKQGKEIIKVGVDASGNLVTETKYGEIEEAGATKLKDAEFSLYKKGTTEAIRTAKTDDEGLMLFTGLDAGEYFIKETKAPEGYILDETEIPVVISAKLNEQTGKLESYSITINGNITATYEGTYDNTDEPTVTVKDDSKSAMIKNKKSTGLPHTGGVGTVIFTVIGSLIMGLSIALFVKNRKKNSEVK